jgi:hypothetical protein
MYIVSALINDNLPSIDFNPKQDTAGMYMDVLKHREIYLNRKNHDCKDYQGGKREFNECIRNALWSLVRKNMTCVYPGTMI